MSIIFLENPYSATIPLQVFVNWSAASLSIHVTNGTCCGNLQSVGGIIIVHECIRAYDFPHFTLCFVWYCFFLFCDG